MVFLSLCRNLLSDTGQISFGTVQIYTLIQGGLDPVLQGHNSPGFSVLPGRPQVKALPSR